jgi:hypothetical protein
VGPRHAVGEDPVAEVAIDGSLDAPPQVILRCTVPGVEPYVEPKPKPTARGPPPPPVTDVRALSPILAIACASPDN